MDRWTQKRPNDESSDESSSNSAGDTGFSYKNFRPRKKPAPRRADPGRRYRSGRVYDSALGITCHFCRQKTTEKHVVCCGRMCVLAFCGSCLHNRHGEDIHIETANDDYTWICPKCRGGCGPGCKNCCNCTFCRKDQNLRPPKIPSSEMHACGFDNVHDYLIYQETGESPESISARKLGKGWCHTHKKNAPNSYQDTRAHEQRGTYKYEGIDEVLRTEKFSFHEQRKRETNTKKGSDKVDMSVIHEQSEKHKTNCKDVMNESNVEDTLIKESFPSQFSSQTNFRKKLEAKLVEPFNPQELAELWDAIRCRKFVCNVSETSQGIHSFPIKKLGSSYIDHHPDLGRKLTATSDKEEKLRLLRGFFFWLEHASMSGSYRPWLDNDEDEDCLELPGPDCEVLGVLINLDKHHHEEDQENTMHNKIKQDITERVSPRAKIIFNWDEEDVKPTIKEKWVKHPSINTGIHVKEEQDTW